MAMDGIEHGVVMGKPRDVTGAGNGCCHARRPVPGPRCDDSGFLQVDSVMRTRCAPIAETRRDSSRSAPRVDDAAAGFQMGSRRDEVGVHRRGPHIACGRFRCGQAGDDARARVSGRSPRRRRRYARHARSHASKISLACLVVDTECTSFGMPAGCRQFGHRFGTWAAVLFCALAGR